jgi:hypothetical protein
MRKKTLKIVALIACFSILSLYVPGLFGVEKAERFEKKGDVMKVFMKPAVILSYFLPFLSPIFYNSTKTTAPSQNSTTNTVKKIKITGDAVVMIPSTDKD